MTFSVFLLFCCFYPSPSPPAPCGRRMMGSASAKLPFTQQIPALGFQDRFLAARWPLSLRPHAGCRNIITTIIILK